MIVTLSPAKRQNFAPVQLPLPTTTPHFEAEAHQLFTLLGGYSVAEIATLMKINPTLAHHTYESIHTYLAGLAPSKAAGYAYDGAVYRSLAPHTLSVQQLTYAQQHLRLLSGMYGMLRPLDRIAPYRLEMAHPLPTEVGKSLYPYWQEALCELFGRELLADDGVWINLASLEYSKALPLKLLPKEIRCITPEFKQLRPDGSYKTIVTAAKSARGAIARYIIDHQITDPEQLKGYSLDGYNYMPSLSTASHWIYVR